jgi:hypothetical protein
MLQLVYNVHNVIMLVSTSPSSIMKYICNWFSIMIPIDMISMATNAPLLKYYYSTMLWL